jgi:BirA family transcriptional regulator, biotin operon repressor / biotin---[acetyl-CoA-carboxylase] ligase
MNKIDIQKGLRSTVFGKTICLFDSIDSTNLYAKTLTKRDGPHGTVIIAEEQTEGRGRLQRQWLAAKGENLLFSILIFPEFSTKKISLLPFAGALAVADAIETVTGLSSTTKWPNDVLVNSKKVCGMLLESVSGASSGGKIILGIGVNVNQTEYIEHLQHKATSLRIECGKEIDRILLLQKILEEFEFRYEQLSRFPSDQMLSDWKMKALLFGKKIVVLEHEVGYSATALDIADDGSLLIQMEDGTKRNIRSGDVSLKYT